MPTIEHSTLSGSELHEPKGINEAASDLVYVSDGTGSGAWKKIYTKGFEDIGDTGTSQALTSGAWTDLTNDGLGAGTLSTYRLPGAGTIWSTVDNQFTWANAGLSIGDTVDIRFDFTVTTTANSDEIEFGLDMAHGDVAEYRLEFLRGIYKNAGTYPLISQTSLYMGNAETLNNPAKLVMSTDNSGNSVVVNGFYVRVNPRNPVYSDA